MTLNELFRRTGEPTYHTPIAVIGELVNQSGGQVTIINPPFGEYREPPHRAERKNWKKSWRFFGVYFTLSSCRVKMRLSNHQRSEKLAQDSRDIKAQLYKKQGGCCPHCGKQFEMSYMELHHILPWARFPELRQKKRNQLLLCHDCHKEIHCNPYLNIKLMEAKAKEFGIDLHDKYDYGEEDIKRGCEDNQTTTD
jgi:5-methylcytosine-specific restriction endonuclease McrA